MTKLPQLQFPKDQTLQRFQSNVSSTIDELSQQILSLQAQITNLKNQIENLSK